MIGIIGAMEEEVSQLIEAMEEKEKVTCAGMDFYCGKLKDKEVVIVQSGIGKVNMALCTQILADRFDVKAVINTGVAAIDYVDCPYECEVNLMLTDNETIHAINKEQREIDRPTDVLSFPMAEYEEPADFSKIEEDPMAFDPESGEFLLGDIVISMDKVWEQAENYGHSREREYAFLIAHSMLHLFGYDHMEEEERKDMEKRQEEILTKTKYTRDERGLV